MATATKTRKKVITNVSLEMAQDAAATYTKIANKRTAIEAKMNLELNQNPQLNKYAVSKSLWDLKTKTYYGIFQ